MLSSLSPIFSDEIKFKLLSDEKISFIILVLGANCMVCCFELERMCK